MSEIYPIAPSDEPSKSIFSDGRTPIPGIDVPHDDDHHGIDLLNALRRHGAATGAVAVSGVGGVVEIPFKTGNLSLVPVPESIEITPGLLSSPGMPQTR